MTGTVPDVSVIIPAYRAEATIARALKSVAAQTLPPKEVILVDDGSPDDTAVVAEACRDGMGDIALKIVRQENAGAGSARNRAIEESSSEFLAFLDADDEWLPEKLARSFDVMTSRELALVAHNYIAIHADGSTAQTDCAATFRQGDDPFVTLFLKGYLSTATLVTRRDLVLKAGGFDEHLLNAQDFELWLRILSDPEVRFEVFGEYLMRYHISENSIMTFTRRRVHCCLLIAARYASCLKGRSGGVYRNLWLRTVIVHAEAFYACRERGQYVPAVVNLARVIPALFAVTFRKAFGAVPARSGTRESQGDPV